MADRFTYDDVSSYSLEDADEQELLEKQNECSFMWTNKEGWPVGVIMSYLVRDGCFWLSVSSLRKRVQAVERDPRSCISITSKGSGIDGSWALTYKGTTEVLKDRETIDWFLPALAERLRRGDPVAQKEFVRLNDTENRRVLKFTPTQRIGFDGRKMRAATQEARR
ncbi:MAG: pyridoxamine 5'-phosphate oxidase family protein [Gammaproteobacteria bacterium]